MSAAVQQILLTILGGAAFAAIVGGAVTLVVRNKNRGDAVDDNSAAQNLQFRGLVQAHVMGFDVPVYQALLELRSEQNYERERRGDQPRAWTELPDPGQFPLYPSDVKVKPKA